MTVNEKGEIISAQDYYPYGEILRSYATGGNVDDKYKYTEKERDTESGWDYFGARYYDSELSRWLQVDPLADKLVLSFVEGYSGWSPYNYTLNNSLKFIDPDGMRVDDYKMDSFGYVTKIKETNDPYDVLYIDNKSLKIDDQTILPGLMTQRENLEVNFTTTQNKNELFKVFKFVSDNTKAEWMVTAVFDNNNRNYILGTHHAEFYTSSLGFDRKDLIFTMHNHPVPYDGLPSSGDKRTASKNMQYYSNSPNKSPFYVYGVKDKTLYNYNNVNSYFIRNINNSNDLYRNLGF